MTRWRTSRRNATGSAPNSGSRSSSARATGNTSSSTGFTMRANAPQPSSSIPPPSPTPRSRSSTRCTPSTGRSSRSTSPTSTAVRNSGAIPTSPASPRASSSGAGRRAIRSRCVGSRLWSESLGIDPIAKGASLSDDAADMQVHAARSSRGPLRQTAPTAANWRSAFILAGTCSMGNGSATRTAGCNRSGRPLRAQPSRRRRPEQPSALADRRSDEAGGDAAGQHELRR